MNKGIIAVLSAVVGAGSGAAAVEMKRVKDVKEKKALSDKHLKMFKMMDHWVGVKQEGKNLAEYFTANGYRKIIIYGMHYVGERLIEELKGTDIEIVCGIDKNAQSLFMDINMITKEETIPEADVIVVTAISFFDEIEEELRNRVSCPIISMEDVVYEL